MYNNTANAGKCRKEDVFLFQFSLNSANYSGISFFKSTFDNCSINGLIHDEFKLLSIISDVQVSDVGSSLVHICYCETGLPDYTKQIPFIDIKPGKKIILDVAIVDRGNHATEGSIESQIRGSVLIRDDQKIQKVLNGCTHLIFNIYSYEVSLQLIMSPLLEKDSIYAITESSKRNIELHFLACIDCPIGFQQIKDDAKGCDCVCDVMKYIVNCNYIRETIIKKGTTAWITYLSIKNTSGYLIYPHCPMDTAILQMQLLKLI